MEVGQRGVGRENQVQGRTAAHGLSRWLRLGSSLSPTFLLQRVHTHTSLLEGGAQRDFSLPYPPSL